MENIAKCKVERETFESNGKEYFHYFIKGNVRAETLKQALFPRTKAVIPFWISFLTAKWKRNLS